LFAALAEFDTASVELLIRQVNESPLYRFVGVNLGGGEPFNEKTEATVGALVCAKPFKQQLGRPVTRVAVHVTVDLGSERTRIDPKRCCSQVLLDHEEGCDESIERIQVVEESVHREGSCEAAPVLLRDGRSGAIGPEELLDLVTQRRSGRKLLEEPLSNGGQKLVWDGIEARVQPLTLRLGRLRGWHPKPDAKVGQHFVDPVILEVPDQGAEERAKSSKIHSARLHCSRCR
jgi:hypothetical protein